MPKITKAKARKIIDSRGNPTVEVEIFTEKGFGRCAAPSGASKGTYEVADYPKGGINEGIERFMKEVAPKIVGADPEDQKGFDSMLHEIDGTDNLSRTGGNVCVAASLANAKAAALAKGIPLYKMMLGSKKATMPRPLGNVLGGGKHAINGTTIQEFMALSLGKTFFESAFSNISVHKKVGAELKKMFKDSPLGLGDEKAWVASIDDVAAMELVSKATKEATKENGIEVYPSVDFAASEFFINGKYVYKDRKLSTEEQVSFVADLAKKYNIKVLEDPLEQNDYPGFAELTKRVGKNSLVVGDDLFVTNRKRLEQGVKMHAANAILIKPNQIGTLTDMIDTVNYAKKNGYKTIVSHRSGETEDTTIAHLAVGLSMDYIKSGTIGGERTAKHNELIRIEEELSG